MSLSGPVDCPICNRHFAVQDIEQHADQCMLQLQLAEDEAFAIQLADQDAAAAPMQDDDAASCGFLMLFRGFSSILIAHSQSVGT